MIGYQTQMKRTLTSLTAGAMLAKLAADRKANTVPVAPIEDVHPFPKPVIIDERKAPKMDIAAP